MSVQVENLEKNMAKLTVEVPAETVEKAIQNAYLRQKGRISIPGFRKGKVPRVMIEKMYGAAIFYEDAVNEMLQDEYPKAVDESGVDIVSRPTINVEQIETGKPFIFTAEVAVKPEVKLGDYVGVQVEKADTDVTEEELTAEVERERESNARMITVEGRAIEDGDTAVIDYEGSVDGVPFEGGKGENHPLVIGSHSFIDTFEEQLIGKNAGDETEVNVTFPEEYHAAELAGKPAVFKVKINEVKSKELPELDDEFAQDVSEFDTLEEYKEDLKKQIAQHKEADAKRKQEDEAISQIVEKSEMEIPDAMVDTQVQSMIEDFESRLMQQGLALDQYMQMMGMTMEGLDEQMRPEALKRIQTSLVLEAIAQKEQIEVTEEDVNAEIERVASLYGMEADKMREQVQGSVEEGMKKDLAVQKAVDFIMEHVQECEKK